MRVELIAEIGQNHNGDMGLARQLIREAKLAGADVAKFQLFDARRLFEEEGNPWFEYNLNTEISREDLDLLKLECDDVGIEFMASAFDVERVNWLEELGVKRHKVASRSIRDSELIDAMVQTGKPVIASLGMWNEDSFPEFGSKGQVIFLYCVSRYPARSEDFEFSTVDFGLLSGFSDHSEGTDAAKIAIARGAQIVEKHFTLDKALYGPDHSGSMTPLELRDLTHFREFFQEAW